ncbi:FeoB small GTPase domain-containing protein, partial [Bifidobacterium sp.]|uniref:FeoB small GTPase domain-containing protein n=1 Tax=Bifidobacterium sp. TaxID=41200 RepID=UPI003D7D4096
MLSLRSLRGGECCHPQCDDECCRADCGIHGETHGETAKRVVFVGNPNVGKSSMFNALLGAKTRTMNAPGTTVSITCGRYRYEKGSTESGKPLFWQFVDTPGTYSLLPMSPDEQVAVDALTGASGMPAPDLVVVVLDATAMSRSLYLLSMVVELGLPTVVALTMDDLAFRNGCGVDPERLSRLLDGMPVVAVDGRTGEGGKALADAIADGFSGTPVPHGLRAWSEAEADSGDPAADMRAWVESRADARLNWTAGI